jgi:hydrogenase nickel incorporation protein HypA/HybF
MHEVSLVQNLLEQLENIRKNHNAKKILNVVVVIGKFSGVVTDSFVFAFDTIKNESEPTKNANLIIENPLKETCCPVCNTLYNDYLKDNYLNNALICENCKSPLLTADEKDIILKQVEME